MIEHPDNLLNLKANYHRVTGEDFANIPDTKKVIEKYQLLNWEGTLQDFLELVHVPVMEKIWVVTGYVDMSGRFSREKQSTFANAFLEKSNSILHKSKMQVKEKKTSRDRIEQKAMEELLVFVKAEIKKLGKPS